MDLFEQLPSVGGKMGRTEIGGVVVDTGPTLVTMPDVLRGFFHSVGCSMEDHLTLNRVDPACHYRWSDGTVLDLPFDADAVPDAIGAVSPGDAAAVRTYLRDAREVYELTKDIFIFSPFDGMREFFKPKNMSLLPKLPRLRFGSTLHAEHARRFRDRRVIQLFDRFATYNGSSPYLAPATLMVIPWVEIGLGAWYPEGGIWRIADAIAAVAMRCGVRIHTSTRVARIATRDRRVHSVVLSDGTVVDADHVIANADVHTTRRHLLGLDVPEPKDLSCSGIVLQLSVDADGHGLGHHNVLFADDYRAEFASLATADHPHPDATVYVSRAAGSDPSRRGSGREPWFVLVNAPPRGVDDGSDSSRSVWRDGGEAVAEAILARMRTFGVTPTIRAMAIRTPDTMATEWSSVRGALYGASSNSIFSAFLRPRQRSTDVANLWYVGGSAHPGGGVPLVITSGMIAADLIMNTFTT